MPRCSISDQDYGGHNPGDPHAGNSHQHDDPRDDGCWKLRMTAWNDWLAVATLTKDPVGDFIRDARADSLMPKNIFSQAQLRNYLRTKNACEEALHAANLAWRRYRRYLQRRHQSNSTQGNTT